MLSIAQNHDAKWREAGSQKFPRVASYIGIPLLAVSLRKYSQRNNNKT